MSLFTGKERDAESGNDYFEARYFGSSMGRFMSPDTLMFNALRLVNPQRWNMYAYVINIPLAFTDPDGHDAAAVNFSGMVGGLGHEGIVSINPDGGSAQFASFGPAVKDWEGGWGASEPGQLQTYPLPTIQFGVDGLPTDASMDKLINALAKIEHVNPNTVRINYFKTTPQETANLNAWIAQQKPIPNWYRVCSMNCANFTVQGLLAGGAITQSQAKGLSFVPNRLYWELLWITESNKSHESVTTTFVDCRSMPNGCPN